MTEAKTEKDQQQPVTGDENNVDDALETSAEKSEEAIWDDLEAEETGATAEAAPDDDSGAGDDKALAAEASGDEQFDGHTGDEPDDDDSGDESESRAAAKKDDDPFANASEEARAAYEAAQAQIKKLEQSERSQRGRVSTLQRQLNEIIAKPSKSRKAAEELAAETDSGEEGGEDATTSDFFKGDQWKRFKDEYPEVAEPMRALVDPLLGKLTEQEKKLSAIGQERIDTALDEQQTLLEEKHEDWLEVIAVEDFVPWLEEQPRHIQEAAYRNAEKIVDAEEAADVVGRFKAFRSESGGERKPPETGTPARGNGTQRLTGKRQRQLETASGTRSGGPSTAHGIPENASEEEIWKAMDKQEQRQAQRA